MRYGSKAMSAVSRIAWIGQAWLTAAMTLVSGIPHFACRCPDGDFKPFCIGTVSATSGCCCNSNCCSSADGSCCRAQSQIAADQVQAQSCCRHQSRQSSNSPGKQQAIKAGSCAKAPASSGARISQSKTILGKELTAQAFSAPQYVIVLGLQTMTGHSSWQSHQLPPPTDLVTTLQHLLI